MTEGPLSQMEAARLVGCSRDTIVRARRSGRFPNARLDNGRWTIPADDLVDAGLCQPPEQIDGPAPGAAVGHTGGSPPSRLPSSWPEPRPGSPAWRRSSPAKTTSCDSSASPSRPWPSGGPPDGPPSHRVAALLPRPVVGERPRGPGLLPPPPRVVRG